MASIRDKRCVDGGISFHVQVRTKGGPAHNPDVFRKSDAKRWAAETEAAIRQRRSFNVLEAQRHTVDLKPGGACLQATADTSKAS